MDIFMNLFSAAKCSMDIYLSLFQASITLLGFIAVFLVFRYRQIDTYVDSSKETLMSLLRRRIENRPDIAVMIWDMWKKPGIDYTAYFHEFNIDAVDEFVNNIFKWRKLRKRIVRLGLGAISAWGLLSLVFLIIHVISPCLFNNACCSCMMAGISIRLFIISMIFTLFFVSYSLCAKRPE